MSAQIFGERFSGARTPAWHGLGTVFNDSPSASEAFSRTGLDYPYLECPVLAQVDGSVLLPVAGKKAIVRGPTLDDPMHRTLAVVSEDFGVIQNMEIARMLDVLSNKWPIETVGALGQGETIFGTFDAGQAKIGGDDIHKYFLFSDSKDGSRNLEIAFTPVRVVCQNTLTLGLKQASSRFTLGHKKTVRQYAEWGINVIARLQANEEVILADLNALTEIRLDAEEVRLLLNQIYPEPVRSGPHGLVLAAFEAAGDDIPEDLQSEYTDREHGYARWVERAQLMRSSATELLARFNDEQPPLAWTAWALYNSVVELEDFRRGKGDVAMSAVFGQRATTKARAFNLISRDTRQS